MDDGSYLVVGATGKLLTMGKPRCQLGNLPTRKMGAGSRSNLGVKPQAPLVQPNHLGAVADIFFSQRKPGTKTKTTYNELQDQVQADPPPLLDVAAAQKDFARSKHSGIVSLSQTKPDLEVQSFFETTNQLYGRQMPEQQPEAQHPSKFRRPGGQGKRKFVL
eukprot:TRINITY_DN60517_c0_g1_i2.p1 TRINITY_DN60517_c0_g1~~TRINITY_DN60517_c0_g1_i2.p1  ORF type:complete len:162 (-),score=0.36 TRINITY_DN60517_c0_g1_i2:463-948(-)